MTEEELRVIAWTLLGEAAGEGTRGMEAVAHVIRNRALSGRYPGNPAAVALQQNSRGVSQFSTWNALTNGGNIPRARFPVGSTQFNNALRVAAKVFGPTPGSDPTQGATHYYAPKGMPGGAPPYWWRDEARKGEKRIGGHIYAVRRDPPSAVTPARRTATDPGRMPTANELTVFRTGQPMQLPTIGPKGGPELKKVAPSIVNQSASMREQRSKTAPTYKVAPTPAKQSMRLADSREMAGAVSATNLIYDPVAKTLVPKLPSARSVIREAAAEQQATRSDRPVTAKQVQRVAGFSVPGGTDGIAAVDAARRSAVLKTAKPTFAGEDRGPKSTISAKPRQQTSFAPNIAQPNGSLLDNKDESRLRTATRLDESKVRIESGGLSRDALAARAAGITAAANLRATQLPPPPRPAPVRAPVAVAVPQTTPLRIVVSGANPVAEVVRKSVVDSIRDEGYSPSEAYDLANLRAQERAESNATKGHSVSGGRQYDPSTASWR